MKTRPDISDDEIQAMMDFDKVLERYRSAKSSGKFTKPALWITGTALVISLVAWFAFGPAKSTEPIEVPDVEKPLVIPQKTGPATIAIPETKQPASTKPIQVKPGTQPGTKPTPSLADVYTEAEPLNGYPDLYTYFQKELKYPVEVLKDSIEGIVSVSFVINRDGKPEQIKILNSLGTAFDNEAIRVISGMPPWRPASLNGKAMPARISMPLTFQVERTQKQP